MRKLHQRTLLVTVWATLLALVSLAISPGIALAGNTSWTQDTNLVVGTHNLVILAPSSSNSLSVNSQAGTFTLTVAAGESFKVRYPGAAGTLANNGSITSCNYVDGHNDVTVSGPVNDVVFTPNSTPCAPGGGGSTTPTVTVSQPNGGETLTAGTTYSIFWSASGSGVQGIRLSFSADAGASYSLIADNVFNNGFYSWTVPSVATTQGRVKVDALGTGGSVLASDTSDANFTITVPSSGGGGGGGTTTPPPSTTEPPSTTGPTPEPTYPSGPYDPVPYTAEENAAPAFDPTATGTYTASGAISATPTINIDKGLVPPSDPATKLPCIGGTLIKLVSDNDPTTTHDTTVYYCGKNGRRYFFPNARIYFTWFADFSSVASISAETMAKIPLAGNITPKPGVKMVKIQTDPKVYAISRAGLLRWVKSEAAAARLYGPLWNRQIDDVPDSFFFNYQLGEPIQ